MLTCRSIPPEVWEHARHALVVYFSRRHRIYNAEDLAQETLTAILRREDFEFEREDEFLRVCYGFACKISLAGYRADRKHESEALRRQAPLSAPANFSLEPAEAAILLDEVIRIGKTELLDHEWEKIQEAAREPDVIRGRDSAEANRSRVKLFRARKRLKELTGWG